MVYAQGERPTSAKDKEFIEISQNGVIKSLTNEFDAPNGNLSFGIYVSTTDGAINRNRHIRILSQIEDLIEKKQSEKYYYQISTQNIMNLTNNFINGFSAQVINITWEKSN